MSLPPLSPLEQRALFLAYYRSRYGPILGIMENEVERLHYVDLINSGLLTRSEQAPKRKTSRNGQAKMMVITPLGIMAKNKLLDLGYEYSYITSLEKLPDEVNLNDALEWINYERLTRGFPTMSIGWLRKWVNQPYREGNSVHYLRAHKVGRHWMIPKNELAKRKRHLIKPTTHYSKSESRRRKLPSQ